MSQDRFGFIGLGNMGGPMARNIREKGHWLVVFDIAGTAERAPAGAVVGASVAQLCEQADVIALSLPTVQVNREVVEQIAQAGRAGSVVIDTCTIGSDAAVANAKTLAQAGIEYVDSPVSGLKFRAEEGSLASITAGTDEICERARPLIEGYSRMMYRVGNDAGQGQRMKVVNNALYLSSLVTTAEALAYGEKGGLDMSTMLDVINASSGMNFTTSQLFNKYLLDQQSEHSGAEAHIIKKDLELFVRGASAEGSPGAAIAKAYETVAAFSDLDPLQDVPAIYEFVKNSS